MPTHRTSEHPNEEALLAYLDGELSNSRIRTVRDHLKSCWKCRSVLADMESKAEAVSRLLSVQTDSDFDRSIRAKERFLRWRDSFEKRRLFLFPKRHSILFTEALRVGLA
jgi:anti-sigma factor RsiW